MHVSPRSADVRGAGLRCHIAAMLHQRTVVCRVSRREVSLVAAVSWAALCHPALAGPISSSNLQQLQPSLTIAADLADAQTPAAAASPPAVNKTTGSNAPCDVQLDPALAAAFMSAVYQVVQQQQLIPEQQLQRERYKLQNQEYKYYAAANKHRMPQLPDLEDNSGGLSNRPYYNFVSYCLWKTVAKHLTTPEHRTSFCAAVGEVLLPQLLPDTVAAVQAAAVGGTPAPAQVIIPAIQSVLTFLQQHGHLCGYQLVLGGQPGTWPADWAQSEGKLVDDFGLLEQQKGPLPAGTVFQVKLLQPADIEGSVALRAEDDGFWSRHISSMLAALLHTAGYSSAAADEYFYQDYWQGPSSAADKLLMMFGDPLQQVEVPWTPTTLVQNWTL